LLLGMLAILAATGYLLYYAVDDGLRDVVRWAHWMVGVLLAVVLAIHVVRARAKRERLKAGLDRSRASV
jgi:hypothetical protein